MKNIIRFTIALILSTFIFIACSKDEEPTDVMSQEGMTTLPTDEEIFYTTLTNDSAKTWGKAYFEVLNVKVDACRYDDLMTLKNDGTYSYDNGSDFCGGGDLQNKTGLWELDFTNNLLYFDRNTSEENTAVIKSISDSTITITGTWLGMDLQGDYSSL